MNKEEKACLYDRPNMFRKKNIFHFPLQHIFRLHIDARDFQSSQRHMRVYSHSYWLANLANFCTSNNSSPGLSKGEVAKY